MNVNIRTGERKDLPYVLALIKELADYEKAPDAVTNNLQMLEEDGFGPNSIFRFLIAEVENQIVGMALFYPKYSTWKGRGIYLDDIVITEKFRRHGIGKLLFDELVKICKNEKVKLLWWQVLDWNTPAINFYKKYNSGIENGWLNCVLLEDDLSKL